MHGASQLSADGHGGNGLRLGVAVQVLAITVVGTTHASFFLPDSGNSLGDTTFFVLPPTSHFPQNRQCSKQGN